jgi:hypothetical protein
VGDGVVFVSTAGSARFPPQVYAIELATGELVEQHTATGQPYDLLVAPDGRLWAAGDRHPDQAGGAGINVHDPRSLIVVDHVDLPATSYSLALVRDEMWVGSDGAVEVLDAATLDLVRTVPIGGSAYQLQPLPDGSGVVAVEGNQLELISAEGAVVGTQPVDADGNIVAATTGPTIFVRAPIDADSTILVVGGALDAAPRSIGVDTDSTGGGLLATARGDVVLVDDRRDEVLCLPGGEPPAVSTTATDLVGVLAELPGGRLLFATSTGVAAREIDC